jgi:hypothetical protein
VVKLRFSPGKRKNKCSMTGIPRLSRDSTSDPPWEQWLHQLSGDQIEARVEVIVVDDSIAYLEEIACKQGFITRDQVLTLAKSLEKSGYGNYLTEVAKSA